MTGIYSIIISVIWAALFVGNLESSVNYQLIVFEGSDWCMNCRRLDRNVLTDPTFDSYLDVNRIELVRVDFPQRDKQEAHVKHRNDSIAEKYDFEAVFPSIVLVDLKSNTHTKLSYSNEDVLAFKGRIDHLMKNIK